MTLRRCSVTRAPSTKPFQNSSASCGSNVPIHSATGLDVVDEERPARQVERDLHERLVERHERVREPAHAALVAERLAERAARARCRRLRRCGAGRPRGRPSRRSSRSKPRVLAELLEHVVEERDAGRRSSSCRVPSTTSVDGRPSSPSSPGAARLRRVMLMSRPPAGPRRARRGMHRSRRACRP